MNLIRDGSVPARCSVCEGANRSGPVHTQESLCETVRKRRFQRRGCLLISYVLSLRGFMIGGKEVSTSSWVAIDFEESQCPDIHRRIHDDKAITSGIKSPVAIRNIHISLNNNILATGRSLKS